MTVSVECRLDWNSIEAAMQANNKDLLCDILLQADIQGKWLLLFSEGRQEKYNIYDDTSENIKLSRSH